MIDGTPGHHVHVADAKARRARHLVDDQVGALWNARHAQPRLVQILFGDPREQHGARSRIDIDWNAERLGHAIGGDVVMGRADAAGGEDIGIAVAERVERRDDLLLDIGHDADLAHVDTDIGQIFGDVADVLVLGPSGQDFVADDQDGGGDDVGFRAARVVHGASPALIPGRR